MTADRSGELERSRDRTPVVRFDWDPRKALANRRKHGVGFAEAVTAFSDPLSITIDDPDHSVDEDRFILIGHATGAGIVVVVHTFRADVVRVISARVASRRERETYEAS